MTTAARITTDEAKDLVRRQLSQFATDPDAFPAALATRARMPHRYSVANMLLILSQAGDPDVLADRIAPRTLWARDGYLPAGSPVFIWSKPMTGHRLADGSVTFRKLQGDEDAQEFHAFRLEPTYPAARVVDVNGHTAQITGEPLTGEPAELYGRLASWLRGQGWAVAEQAVDHAGGWTSHAQHLVRIDPRFTGWDRVRVLVHEATHALMHADSDDYSAHRGDREAEADGVAFAVLSAYGQTEAAGRTVRYVANWAEGDTDRIQAAMQRAAAALDTVLDVLAAVEDVTAPAVKPSKADNKALAAWLRAEGLPVKGAVWQAAKSGERDTSRLAALAA